MTYGLYSIRDHYSAFGSPFSHTNEATAKRYFARIVNKTDGDISFAPGDYDLYHIGDFDDRTGMVTMVSPIEFVCSGMEVFGVYENEK